MPIEFHRGWLALAVTGATCLVASVVWTVASPVQGMPFALQLEVDLPAVHGPLSVAGWGMIVAGVLKLRGTSPAPPPTAAGERRFFRPRTRRALGLLVWGCPPTLAFDRSEVLARRLEVEATFLEEVRVPAPQAHVTPA